MYELMLGKFINRAFHICLFFERPDIIRVDEH